MTLLVAAVIVHDEATRRVALVRRGPAAKFAQGRWDLPVGKSNLGESILETAVRELREETGLRVDTRDLTLAHVIHGARGVEAPDGFVTVVFAATSWSGELINAEPEKHSDVAWVEVSGIPRNFVPTTYSALTGYLSGSASVTLDGWST